MSKMDLREEALSIAKVLKDSSVPYAFCGAVALAIHGYPRATKDIDILIDPGDLDLVRKLLAEIEYDLDAGLIPFDQGTPHERRIFRISKAIGNALITIDLLLAAGVFTPIWEDREVYELDSQQLQVVSRKGLIAMKRIAGRTQDLADIEALEGGATGE